MKIHNYKVDVTFEGIPNRMPMNKNDKYTNAKEQEKWYIEKYNKETLKNNVATDTQISESSKFDSLEDKLLGDIMIVNKKTYKTISLINLKVALYGSKPYYLGCIPVKDIITYGKVENNHYFICVSAIGDKYVCVKAHDVYNLLYDDSIKGILAQDSYESERRNDLNWLIEKNKFKSNHKPKYVTEDAYLMSCELIRFLDVKYNYSKENS